MDKLPDKCADCAMREQGECTWFKEGCDLAINSCNLCD